MIFYVFHSNSGLLDSLKNVVSEHLEWLKFQKFSRSFTSKPTLGEGGGGLQHPPHPSVVPRIAHGMHGAFN